VVSGWAVRAYTACCFYSNLRSRCKSPMTHFWRWVLLLGLRSFLAGVGNGSSQAGFWRRSSLESGCDHEGIEGNILFPEGLEALLLAAQRALE